MIILLILTIISLIIYVIFKTVVEPKIEIKWLQVLIDVLLVALIIPICVNLMMPIFQREQQRKEEEFKEQVTSYLLKEKMSTEDIKELISLKYKEIFKSSEEDAKKWTNKFLSSLPERKSDVDSLLIKGEELANKLRLKWQPLYDYILLQIDTRINELMKKDENIKFQKYDLDIISIDSSRRPGRIREIEFTNGCHIRIQVYPAQIQNGLLTEFPIITFAEISNQLTSPVFMIGFFEDNFEIDSVNKRYEDIEFTTQNDPLDNEEFKNKLSEAINKIITSVYMHK